VQAVILRLAAQKNVVEVSFWTHLEDKERQHRRWVELLAKGTPFWVTYNWEAEVPRTGARIVKVKDDPWREGVADAYYRAKDGGWYRRVVRRAA